MRSRGIAAGFAAVVASVGGVAVSSSVAGADPANAKNAITLTVPCDNGVTYTAVANGGGNAPKQSFNPAHDINSTSTLVPTSFGTSTMVLKDSQGNTVDSGTNPPATKGNSQGAGDTPLNCSFSFSNTFTITMPVTLPDGTQLSPGTYTETISGTVTGFIPSQK
jgi:hypothetical protein